MPALNYMAQSSQFQRGERLRYWVYEYGVGCIIASLDGNAFVSDEAL
jgi:hypothetical protein